MMPKSLYVNMSVHAARGRGQENRPSLRGLGREKFHGPEISRRLSRDLPHRAGRPDQKDLAAGEAGGTRGGSAGGAVI